MEQNTNVTVDKNALETDLRAFLGGSCLAKDKVDDAVGRLRSTVAQHPAQGQIACLVFYSQVTCQVTGGKSFVGHAGGLCTPGGNGAWGHLYTDDLDAVYRNTAAFSYIVTPVYFTIEFWDANSKLLGHFQGGGIGISSGTGGGTGTWT